MKSQNVLRVFPFILVASILFGQPNSSADFGHRTNAMGGIYSVLDGEGNAIDIFDVSNGTNFSASHFNEGLNVPIEWQQKYGGADRYAMDVAFRNLEYRGPDDDHGNKRSWYWVDGVSRIMVDKGFENGFSMRINFNGGYQTIRKSWQDGYAPWPNEIRHSYSAATLNWDDIAKRATTTGAGSIDPLGEFYASYHIPIGLSLSFGGGYSFTEFEDMYYANGWKTSLKGNVAANRLLFGARWTYPDFSDYFALGLNYGIINGKVNNEKDEDYLAYEDSDNLFGFQAEFGYPEYLKGALGYQHKAMEEDYYTSDSDTLADESKDDYSSVDFRLRILGDGLDVPVVLGVDLANWKTNGESDNVELEIAENTTAFGISTEPVEDMLTFAAQYEMMTRDYRSLTDDVEGSLESSRISFGTEVYPTHVFGVRLGFEILEVIPDSSYDDIFYGYIFPYVGPYGRFHFVPDIEKGNAITGGFVFRLDDDRFLIELSARHYFADEPEIYKENGPNCDEAYFGLTYYLK
ncbi:hypothetical protein KAH81_07195 [bacterium]|nr:hypothetical protein [bacterium]